MPHSTQIVRHRPYRSSGYGALRQVARHSGGMVRRFASSSFRRRAGQAAHAVGKAAYNHLFGKKKSVTKVSDGVPMQAGHSGLSRSTVRLGRNTRGLRKHEKLCGSILYRQTFSSNPFTGTGGPITCTAGGQTVVVTGAVGTPQQFTTNSGSTYVNNPALNDTGYFSLNPNATNTGSSIVPVQTQPNNDVIYVKSWNVNIEFTNFGAVGIYFDVYLMTPRKLTNMDPLTAWQSGYSQDGLTSGASVLPAPGTQAYTQGYEIISQAFARPQESIVFNKYWKIVSVKSLNISSSASELVNFDIKIGRSVRRDFINQLPTGVTYMPGISYATMAVTRGSLVIDVTVPATPLTTYGEHKWGFVNTETARLCPVTGQASRIRFDRTLSAVPAKATGANQKILNEVDTNVTVLSSEAN